MGRWSQRVAPSFVGFVGVQTGEGVLDVGCGTGSLTLALAAAGVAAAVGVDPSSPYVGSRARARPAPWFASTWATGPRSHTETARSTEVCRCWCSTSSRTPHRWLLRCAGLHVRAALWLVSSTTSAAGTQPSRCCGTRQPCLTPASDNSATISRGKADRVAWRVGRVVARDRIDCPPGVAAQHRVRFHSRSPTTGPPSPRDRGRPEGI